MFNLLKVSTSKTSLYQHNVKYIQRLEFSSSLMFLIPVWVSFELRILTLAQLAMIEATIAFAQLALELPTGALADLLGRKKTIALGYFFDSLGYFLFAFATDFWSFLAFSLLFGVGEALISGAKEALIFDTLKQSHKEKVYPQLMNQLQVRFYWGMAISTLIGGFLYQWNIYVPTFLTSLAFFTCAIFAICLREPALDSEKFTFKNYLKQTKEGFHELFSSQRAKKISFFYILLGALSWPMVISFKNITMNAVGLTELQIGYILPIINLLNVYTFRLALQKKWFDNLGRTFIILTLVTATSWLVLALHFAIANVLLIIFLLSFISSCRWNVIGKLTNLCFSSKNRATAISTLSMAISLSYTAVMLIFSFFSQFSQQSLTWIFLLMACLGLFILLPLALHLSQSLRQKKIVFDLQVENATERSLEQQEP